MFNINTNDGGLSLAFRDGAGYPEKHVILRTQICRKTARKKDPVDDHDEIQIWSFAMLWYKSRNNF